MKSIGISKFKSLCLGLLDQVYRSSEPMEITRNGVPIAVIYPAKKKRLKDKRFGCMQGSGEVLGEIVAPPSIEEQGWEVIKAGKQK